MSLEDAILKLADAVNQNTTIMIQGNALLRESLSSAQRAANAGPPETGLPAAQDTAPDDKDPASKAPAASTKRRGRAAPVVQPPVAETPAADDLGDGFGDDADGFGDDDDAGAATVKVHTAATAVACLKGLRDAARDKHGAEQGLAAAKAALQATGFPNLDSITDEKANEVVEIALRYATNHGVLEEMKLKAVNHGAAL